MSQQPGGGLRPFEFRHWKGFVVVVVDGAAGVGVTAGTAGRTGLDAMVPAMGGVIGTPAAELTPRLPISLDPSGIPVRAAPPGVIDEVDVGVEDDAMLLEPEPHIPVIPEVSSMPEVVDIPDVDGIVDDVEVPAIAAEAGAAVPGDIPPPSKLEVDPNIDVGAVPTVEHAVLLGAEIVPVALAGAGLVPGDAISVDPRGMPAGPTVEPVPMPSGEVAPMTGVGLAIPVTCAMAALQTISAGKTTAVNESLICILHLKASIARNHADRLDGESAGPAHGLQLNTHLCSWERTPSMNTGVRVTHPVRRDRRLIQ